MIELADVLDRLLELLIIVEPAPNLDDPLAPHAELSRAPACVGHGQNEHPMPLTAGALGTALGVPDSALEQRAPQQLASEAQFADKALTCSKGVIANHSQKGISDFTLRQPPIRPTLQFFTPQADRRKAINGLSFCAGK